MLPWLVRTDINERATGPTEWCAPMEPVQKSNGKLRICVDLRNLNSAVKRARFVLPTLEDIAPKLAGAQYVSIYFKCAVAYYRNRVL